MPRSKPVLATILFALSLQLPAFVTAQTPQKEGTATVSGRVTLKGEPVPNVAIGIQPQNQQMGIPDRSKYFRARTDAEGRFRFSAVPAGQYLISALAPGLISPSDTPYGIQGKTLHLTDGENTENLTLELKRGGVIAGRITDSSGNGIVETIVRLMKMNEAGKFIGFSTINTAEFSQTDDRGAYRLFGLPAGKYKVSVGESQQAGGRQPSMNRIYYAQTFHPNAPNEAQAKVIEVSEGSEATDVDIKLGQAKEVFDVAGRVVDAETGKPVPATRLGFGTFNSGGGLDAYVTNDSFTDAAGEFEFRGLMPGKYAAFVGVSYDGSGEHYSEATTFEVSDVNVTGVEIKALRGVSISGAVVIEGTNDPAVLSKLSQLSIIAFSAARETTPINRNTKVSANGSFRISGLKPAKISFRYFPRVPGLSLLRIEHNGALLAGDLELHHGEPVTGIKMVFGYGTAVLRGQLKIVGGNLPEGSTFYVRAIKVGGTSAENITSPVDARGQFLLKDLAAGEYELKAAPLFYTQISPDQQKLMALFAKFSHRVTVANSGETQTEMVIDLSQKENDK